MSGKPTDRDIRAAKRNTVKNTLTAATEAATETVRQFEHNVRKYTAQGRSDPMTELTAVSDISTHELENAVLKDALANLRAENEKLQAALTNQQSQSESEKTMFNATLNAELERLASTHKKELETHASQNASEKEMLNEALTRLNSENTSLKTREHANHAKIATLSNNNASLLTELDASRSRSPQVQAELRDHYNELNKVKLLNQDLEAMLDKAEVSKIQAMQSITELRAQLNACRDQIRRAEMDKASDLAKLDALHAEQLHNFRLEMQLQLNEHKEALLKAAEESTINRSEPNSAEQTAAPIPTSPHQSPVASRPSSPKYWRAAPAAPGRGRVDSALGTRPGPASTALGEYPATPEVATFVAQALLEGVFRKRYDSDAS